MPEIEGKEPQLEARNSLQAYPMAWADYEERIERARKLEDFHVRLAIVGVFGALLTRNWPLLTLILFCIGLGILMVSSIPTVQSISAINNFSCPRCAKPFCQVRQKGKASVTSLKWRGVECRNCGLPVWPSQVPSAISELKDDLTQLSRLLRRK